MFHTMIVILAVILGFTISFGMFAMLMTLSARYNSNILHFLAIASVAVSVYSFGYALNILI